MAASVAALTGHASFLATLFPAVCAFAAESAGAAPRFTAEAALATIGQDGTMRIAQTFLLQGFAGLQPVKNDFGKDAFGPPSNPTALPSLGNVLQTIVADPLQATEFTAWASRISDLSMALTSGIPRLDYHLSQTNPSWCTALGEPWVLWTQWFPQLWRHSTERLKLHAMPFSPSHPHPEGNDACNLLFNFQPGGPRRRAPAFFRLRAKEPALVAAFDACAGLCGRLPSDKLHALGAEMYHRMRTYADLYPAEDSFNYCR